MQKLSAPSFMNTFRIKALVLAIASLSTTGIQAAPAGGVVVGGSGNISQSGTDTTINQNSERLALEWDSFNVNVNERVQFIQPGRDSVALNRILGNSGSQILGRIDANGHVILMNPNGVFFGADAQVDVGGLVATGLNINAQDFMNGDLVFSGVDGTSGVVINQGLIQAAVGGNVALLGKSVVNEGLISAHLGHVALASGSEAVVTFDSEGLIGVRIDQETLAEELGSAYAVTNAGTLEAKGGKILLSASVSSDLFSEAVNHGGLNSGTEVVLHDDGSFSLGRGNDLLNTGVVDVSASDASGNAGYIVLAAENIDQSGALLANTTNESAAGQIYLESDSEIRLTQDSRMEALSAGVGGKVRLVADIITGHEDAVVDTSGNVLVTGYLDVELPQINANHFYLNSIGTVTQNGAAQISGNTHIEIYAGADVLLDADNDLSSLSVDAGHTSQIQVTERDGLVLKSIDLQDSSLSVTLIGEDATLIQETGSDIIVDGSSLYLSADHIRLGEGDSRIRVYMGELHLEFGRSIDTNGSIELEPLSDDIAANSARVVGRDLQYGDEFLHLEGDREIDIKVALESNLVDLAIHRMTGSNAALLGYVESYQTGPIRLSGTLTWNSYAAQLDHPENDVAMLEGTGGWAFGGLEYVDKNDLILGDLITGSEVSVDIRSVGANATLQQAAGTMLKADLIDLQAHNINLGAEGESELKAGYVLNITFGGTLDINGPWHVSSYAPVFRVFGNNDNNRLIFGPHSTNTTFLLDNMGTLHIDLGGGNDRVIFNSAFVLHPSEYAYYLLDLGAGADWIDLDEDMYIPLLLGSGRDRVRLGNAAIHYEAIDYDPSEDVLYVRPPAG
jgi:filamentous hemagglutinin family protein